MSQQSKANQAAFDIGQMTERMAQGYYMHVAAIQVAKDPRAIFLSPNVEPGQIVPVGRIRHKMALGTSLTSHTTWPKREPIQPWLLI